MKTPFFLFLTFFMFLSCAFAQQHREFAPIGAEWYYNATNFECDHEGREYIHFWVSKDTLVGGKTCRYIENDSKRVVDLQNSCYSEVEVPPYIMYEKNQKVYNWYNGRFFLVFDFDVNIGDTLNLYIQPALMRIYYDSSLHPIELPDTMYLRSFIVDNIDSISVDGGYLKEIKMDIGGYSYYSYFERIGILDDYIISRHPPIEYRFYSQKIRCYRDTEISYTHPDWQKSCDWRMIGIDNVNTEELQINIRPNPAKEFISIQIPEKLISSCSFVSINNLYGKICFKQQITSPQTQVNISALPAGVYFIKIQSMDKIYKTTKIIKL